MELLERASAAGGQLLRVEMQRDGLASQGVSALLFTFDIGRVQLRVDPLSGQLEEDQIEIGQSVSSEFVNADEEDPWWRVLGSPLSRVLDIASEGSSDPGALGVALQFRSDEDNPRRIAVLARDGGLLVQLQPDPRAAP